MKEDINKPMGLYQAIQLNIEAGRNKVNEKLEHDIISIINNHINPKIEYITTWTEFKEMIDKNQIVVYLKFNPYKLEEKFPAIKQIVSMVMLLRSLSIIFTIIMTIVSGSYTNLLLVPVALLGTNLMEKSKDLRIILGISSISATLFLTTVFKIEQSALIAILFVIVSTILITSLHDYNMTKYISTRPTNFIEFLSDKKIVKIKNKFQNVTHTITKSKQEAAGIDIK